jgi:hypothetical protein
VIEESESNPTAMTVNRIMRESVTTSANPRFLPRAWLRGKGFGIEVKIMNGIGSLKV